MTRTFCISVLLAWVVLILTQATSRADDFRIENSVFTEEDEENEQGPSLRSTTIFHRGVVYDFLNDPPEVIIFDPANSRLILLDVERKLRTDLSPTIVRQAIERLKSLSVGTKDRRKQFLYDPIFEKNVDEETSEQVFDSPWMSYRVLAARSENREVVRQYHQFCDWSARLNTFLRPGSRPPFPRLVVNQELAERHEIPTRIIFTLKTRRGLTTSKEVLRSEHHLVPRLVESDLRRVAGAGEQMAAFKTVTFREYETRADEKEGVAPGETKVSASGLGNAR
ncbi:MAG TPA: hypothetical protein VJL29_00440 [Thermoguttaceae bacterium]|nr:hypothetical protein [Thermoguttaceae bacterium]